MKRTPKRMIHLKGMTKKPGKSPMAAGVSLFSATRPAARPSSIMPIRRGSGMKALFLVLLLLVAAGLLFAIQLEYAVIALLCATSTLIGIGIARYSRDYIVTYERVELIWGIIGRSSKEARICDIRSIDVYEPGLKGLLGLGIIDFSTAANAGIEVQFKDIRGAHAVKDLVRKLQKGVDPTED